MLRATSLGALAVMFLLALLLLTATQGRQSPSLSSLPSVQLPNPNPKPSPDPGRLSLLRARHAALKRQLQFQAPEGAYILVDTARNRLYVKQRDVVLLNALASTGSGTIMDNPGRPGTQWVFDTPRGEYTIQSRLTNPLWVKPDWAFLEEGIEIPTDPAERVEAGTLGEYALGFGKGYFIHGTLYKRLLGKNVTHVCIRLSDEDLKAVYRLTSLGTQVMIF
jgi:lipoprotein-anchoring transpeptidase ErfK/SrfK